MVLELDFLLQNGARPSSSGYRARCPLHGSDHQYSLAVDTARGVFFCHACGARGQVGAAAAAPSWRPSSAPAPDRHDVLERISALYRRQFPGSPAERYLENRGIPPELAMACGAGWADGRLLAQAEAAGLSRAALEAAGLIRADGREVLAGRVVFPLTRAHRLINLYGRAVDPEAPKAWRHRFLSGPRGYFNEPTDWSEACLCEGVLDALSVLACGYPWATALCGLHGVEATDALWQPLRTIVLALDADGPGQERSTALAEAFWQSGKQVFVLEGLAEKDLNAAWQAQGRLLDLEERAAALPPDAWERVAWPSEPARPVAAPRLAVDAMGAMPGRRFAVAASPAPEPAPVDATGELPAALQVLAEACSRVARLIAARPEAAVDGDPPDRSESGGPVEIPVRRMEYPRAWRGSGHAAVLAIRPERRPLRVGERSPP